MDSSPLLSLPPELRLIIYDLALTYTDPIEVQYLDDGNHKVVVTATQRHLLAVTHTCRQIRTECDNIFFRQNSVTLKVTGFPKSLSNYNKSSVRSASSPLRTLSIAVGAAYAAALRSITIDLGNVSIRDLWGRLSDAMMREVLREGIVAASKGPAQAITLVVNVMPSHLRKVRGSHLAVTVDLKTASASLERAKVVLGQKIADGEWGRRSTGSSFYSVAAVRNLLADWMDIAVALEREG